MLVAGDEVEYIGKDSRTAATFERWSGIAKVVKTLVATTSIRFRSFYFPGALYMTVPTSDIQRARSEYQLVCEILGEDYF